MRDFRQIKVWEKAHTLTLNIYKATARFPREELYGLTSQLSRGASSISCQNSGRLWARRRSRAGAILTDWIGLGVRG